MDVVVVVAGVSEGIVSVVGGESCGSSDRLKADIVLWRVESVRWEE